MRSYFLVGALTCVAGVLFVKGWLLSPAGAAGNHSGETEIRFEYADYDDEAPPALPARPETPPENPDTQQEERVADASADAAADDGSKPRWREADDAEPGPAPRADAGVDGVVWIGDHEIALDGSGSEGAGLSYWWRQLSGPVDLDLKSPRSAQTAASGLAQDWPQEDATYEFELTVRDAQGQESVDIVRFTARAAPSITINPSPKRRLAWRDGYLLGHFEAWKTNRTDEAEVFAIRSPSELVFHHLGGTADFDLTPAECNSGFEYQLTIFYRDPESSSFLEFFVDTPERIPAILQFGVNWE